MSCGALGSPSRKECPPHSPESTSLRYAELDTLVFTLRLLMLEAGPRGCRGLWGWVGRGRGGSRVGTIPERIPSNYLDDAHVCEGPNCSECKFRSAPRPRAVWTTAAASLWVSLIPISPLLLQPSVIFLKLRAAGVAHLLKSFQRLWLPIATLFPRAQKPNIPIVQSSAPSPAVVGLLWVTKATVAQARLGAAG